MEVFPFLHQILHSILHILVSPVMMWIQISARVVRGHAPRNFFIKIGAIWHNLSVPKYGIINLKTNNFKGTFRQ